MSKKNRPQKNAYIPNQNSTVQRIVTAKQNEVGETYNLMVEGKEFESLILKRPSYDVAPEIKYALSKISEIRKRPVICYCANVVNATIQSSTSIDSQDDLPFSEMVASIPENIKEIDVILVTPCGSGPQVAKFVDRLRPRFDNVAFILPNIAMSAGTIFVMSGDDIIMDERAYIGPIDPQVRNKEGQFIPAQAILTLIDEIQKRGEGAVKNSQNPRWTDLQILRSLDPKEIGNAINSSSYSVELVETYLNEYKFKNWLTHKTGVAVSDEERKSTAKKIAQKLCDHSIWKNHARGITRDTAWNICGIKITYPESVPGLNSAIRRFWALMHWTFEITKLTKTFVSENYCILRIENRDILKPTK
jgi:Serine dehydrogenase proteinase